MNQKAIKTINIFGIFYALFALVLSMLVFSKASLNFGLDSGWGIAISVAFFVLSFLVFLAESKIPSNLHIPFLESFVNRTIVSIAMAALLIIAGIALRHEALIAGQIELGEYMNISVVDGSPVSYFVNGAKMFYVGLLRAVLLAFGNRYIPAVVFQMVCQLMGLILVYFALRKLCGEICALVFMAFGCLSTSCIEASCTLGPSNVVFLIAALDIFILSNCSHYNYITLILAGCAGLVCGFLVYLDISGLAVIILSLIILKRESDKGQITGKKVAKASKRVISGDRLFSFTVFLAGLFICFVFCLIVCVAAHGGKVSTLVSDMVSAYFPEEFSLYGVYELSDKISVPIAAVFLLLGIPEMIFLRKSDAAILLASTVGISLLTGFGIISSDINGSLFILFFVFALSGKAASVLLSPNYYFETSFINQKGSPSNSDNEELMHTVHKVEDEVEMLQNPLPVPEKKKKKKMEYDYYVPDESDYDL